MAERFQVDLAGVVDLLSRHLYSGPQVYLRELIQNAVDAVTARRGADPSAPAKIRLRTDAGADGRPTLEIADTGIGLTAAGQHRRIIDVDDSLLFAGGTRLPDIIDGLARAVYAPDSLAGLP